MREAKRLKKHYASFTDDYARLLEELHANPTLGTDLGGGLRKIRMRIASKGRGKSGGARVISLTVILSVEETEIDLLYIYDKAERASISAAEIDDLLKKNGLKLRNENKNAFCSHIFILPLPENTLIKHNKLTQ